MKNYEDFVGPTDEELAEAYRRHNQRRATEAKLSPNNGLQSNCRRWIGTPRKAKHRQNFGGMKID